VIRLPTSVPVDVLQALATAGESHGVPVRLLLGVAWTESRFHAGSTGPVTRSGERAQGLMQIMPATARGLGVDPYNLQQAADGGARYLAAQYAKFGDWARALAAYNWGPANVQKRPDWAQWPAQVQQYVMNVWRAGQAAPIPFTGPVWQIPLSRPCSPESLR
jgi:soluble lytic murein transglycosylase-like protein